MIVNGELPDRSQLHPWFADLLDKDADSVAERIRQRVMVGASPELVPLIDYTAQFLPTRLFYQDDAGFVLYLRRTSVGKSVFRSHDFLIFAEPLPDSVIEERVKYFDEDLRPLMREFTSKFAGFGENVEGVMSGQFPLRSFDAAKDRAYHEPEELGEWKDTKVLYHCSAGDLLLINQRGATAWHVHETNNVVPLFSSFPQLIKHFVDLHRSGDNEIDSWSSRQLLGQN